MEWGVDILFWWIIQPVLPLHVQTPDPSCHTWWLFTLSLYHDILQPLTQRSSFILREWTRILIYTGLAWESSILTWLSCLYLCFQWFQLLLINFHIISFNVFFITSIIWSLVFMFFCLFGLNYGSIQHVFFLDLWRVIHLLHLFDVPSVINPVFNICHMLYTPNSLLILYPTKIHMLQWSAILGFQYSLSLIILILPTFVMKIQT